jgi:hypothetical protein
MNTCAQCSMDNTEDATFCRGCGARLGSSGAPSSVPAAPAPQTSALRPTTPVEAHLSMQLGRSSRALWGVLAAVGIMVIGGFGWLLGRSRPATEQITSSAPLIVAAPQSEPTTAPSSDYPVDSSPSPAPSPIPDVSGEWQGSWGGFPSTLAITSQSSDSFSGVLTQRVSKGVFRIAVKGYVSPSTRSVTLQETRIIEERRPGEWGTLGESSGSFSDDWRRMNGGGVTKVQKIKWQWAFSR